MYDQSARHHVVITGTGRSGTTFLMELLTNLGLDTGFPAGRTSHLKDRNASAGLEREIQDEDCPYIVKNPGFCQIADEVLQRPDIAIDHIYIPIRDLQAAAESRRRVTQLNLSQEKRSIRFKRKLLQICYGKQQFKDPAFDGGILPHGSKAKMKQEDLLRDMLYKLLLAASNSHVPVTFMHYPRITRDSAYLYRKLQPLLTEITYEYFHLIYTTTVRTDLVHAFNSQDAWEGSDSEGDQQAA